ncbi:SPL family radical SAM protein [Caproiciproducens faecalis]|uniref:Spore photoproduct lyase n=1 Tax=Caproiciproducens faecalis TaxID=2820301 RepID=A0ABS7DMX5_9FIRM|nr:spore photoproduct lyase [Caproiciproducens faecalis]MBW7572655.1 spore photoproduct lyase [Caproiciproducens faecalis]
MYPEGVYYEPEALSYELGKQLQEKFRGVPWIPIDSHNNIAELRGSSNKEFGNMKRYLIIGIRKTHKYVENHKISDFLVPYTSSGCSAACLYCYLVCNYNKCSYLRLFVNREQMLGKLMKTAAGADRDLTFEIGSNSDLVLENTITGNLVWTIENFAKSEKGFLTFPTKFDMVDPLLNLDHGGRTIFRMSVNPQEVISRVEFGTSPLKNRIQALNKMCDAGYRVGLLIAPVVLLDDWQKLYTQLIDQLAEELSPKAKKALTIEIIFMTYSYVHRAINNEAFPNAVELYSASQMTVRGRGKYCYRSELRAQGEELLRAGISQKLGGCPILYVV